MSSTANAPNRVAPLSAGGSDSLVHAERLRIARELYEVVAYSLVAILDEEPARSRTERLEDVLADVLRAVRVVAAGEALLSPGATRRLVEELTAWPERGRVAPALLGELRDREREVMALVAYGLTNREIAERLVISPATAKAHVSRTMRKLHAHDRAQLVVLAYQTGLVVQGGFAESAAADRIAGRLPA